jgi:hypothetical protein
MFDPHVPGKPPRVTAPTQAGRVLAGRYRLLSALGTGGMGTVWLAVDEVLARQVAVKEVSPPAGVTDHEREVLRERTLREAQTAARLSHPNVVTIYDVVDDGQPWIVMELIPSRSLRDVVQEDGPLTPQQAARVGLQVLAALRAAHALGILHRDVKPGNVLIDADGRAVLADFGIARAQDSPTLTMSGVLVGSPSYIAPERASGAPGDTGSDLWSLGATLYAIVEGRPPYDREGALPTLMAVVNEEPDPPSRAGALWPVISGLLRRDVAARLGPDQAEHMLRQVAEAGSAPGTTPLTALLGGAEAAPGGDGTHPGGSLEQAERTRAFHPQVTELPDRTVPGLPAEPGPAQPPATPAEPPATPESAQPPATPTPIDPPATLGPAEPPAAPAGEPAPRRKLPAWVIAAVAVLAATGTAIGLIAALTTGQPTHSAHPPAPSNSAPGAGSAPAKPTTQPSPARPIPGPAGARAGIPAGYHGFHDSTGFSIAVPNGWRVSHQGHYVYLMPPARSMFLLIDQSDHPHPNPLADWRQQEASRIGTYPGYHRIRLEAIHYPPAEKAADWEFTYYHNGVLTHVLNRNILANAHHAYALYWSTPASEWHRDWHIFRVLADTFRPASG